RTTNYFAYDLILPMRSRNKKCGHRPIGNVRYHVRSPGNQGYKRRDRVTTAVGAPVLVRMSGVRKKFGDTEVLCGIDLEVGRVEVVVVLGPSGSGKSTLCRCINRLETVTAGTISLDGQELPAEGRELSRLRADVGMVFQAFNLFAHRTVLSNVMLGPVK